MFPNSLRPASVFVCVNLDLLWFPATKINWNRKAMHRQTHWNKSCGKHSIFSYNNPRDSRQQRLRCQMSASHNKVQKDKLNLWSIDGNIRNPQEQRSLRLFKTRKDTIHSVNGIKLRSNWHEIQTNMLIWCRLYWHIAQSSLQGESTHKHRQEKSWPFSTTETLQCR